jgi:Carboxyl transferase domain
MGLARLDGMPVDVVSLNCEVNGGALDAQGSQKLTRLPKLGDVMNMPILQFFDIRKPPYLFRVQDTLLTLDSWLRNRNSS